MIFKQVQRQKAQLANCNGVQLKNLNIDQWSLVCQEELYHAHN